MQITSRSDAWLRSAVLRARIAPVLLVFSVWLLAVSDADAWAGRLLLLGQLGLVLLWQPVAGLVAAWSRRTLLWVALAAGFLLAAFSHSLVMLWLALLSSLFGSRMLGVHTRLRRFHLLALSLLLMVLWLMVVPQLAGQPEPLQIVTRYGLPAGLLVLALLPVETVAVRQHAPVDYFYALLVLLVALAVPFGAVFLAATARISYVDALVIVLILLGVGLATLAWLWNPRAGFSGIGALFSAGMLQLGTPFEQWSRLLAQRATSSPTPEVFLHSAVADLATLPGVLGGRWRLGKESGLFGQETVAGHQAEIRVAALELVLYLDHPLAPALHVQFQLIGTLLHEFYLSKVRERHLADMAYLEAIHETGARLTHDIKNLLQSLKVLVAASDASADPVRLNELYARQLPEITRRLETTLGKLSTPQRDDGDARLSALSWWEAMRCRYADAPVDFATHGALPQQVDGVVLSAALDNLIQNALTKSGAKPVGLTATLMSAPDGGACLEVCDTGDAVPAEIAHHLFSRPVPSATGFGVGLYQVAQLALSRGWRIELADNCTGHVCFRVSEGTAR